VAVSLEELMVSFGADTAGFERGAKRVEDKLKDVAREAEKTGEKLSFGDKIKSGFSSLQGTFQSIGSNLANIKAGLDIAKDIGGFFFDMAKGAAEAGSKFHDLSLQTGVSVETFSGLQLQLKQSGTDMDALARAAVFLQKNLGEAASGNKELQRAFAALGIKDVRAALNDTDGSLRTVIKSLGQMESAGQRNAAGSKVMGKGFKELSVFLADTKGDLNGVIAESERAGRVMSTEAANAADEFGDQLDALSNAATIAGRNFGIEFVPEITGGMAEMTDALQVNAGRWREWGAEVADVLRGLREAYDSEFGKGFRQSVGWLWELNAETNPLIQLYRQIRGMGAQSRAGDIIGNSQDLANEMARLRSKNAAAVAPKRDVSDFFTPGKEGQKARKDELDKLKAFAKEWDFTVTALLGGKHNKGSAHYDGRAMDVSVRGKSVEEIERFMAAARQAGYGVRDERTRPEGQKVWSGPHLHLQLQNKATQAAVEATNKAFDEQQQILESLARALADGDLELKSFTQSSVDQQVATEYQRLGIGKLTGSAQELGEAMWAMREAQIRATDAAKEQLEVHMKLIAANKEAGKGFNSEDLLKPSTVTRYGVAEPGMGQTGGKRRGLSDFQVDYWADFREQFQAIREGMRSWREEWQNGLLDMAQNGDQIFARFFMSLQDGWKSALGNMGLAFLQAMQQMAAQAAASAVWGAILNIAGGVLGGTLAPAHGGGGFTAGGKFTGFAAGGSFIVGGSGGTDKTPVGFMATRGERVTVETPGQQRRGGGVTINFHITAPGGNVPRETQNQIARKTKRALGFDPGY